MQRDVIKILEKLGHTVEETPKGTVVDSKIMLEWEYDSYDGCYFSRAYEVTPKEVTRTEYIKKED